MASSSKGKEPLEEQYAALNIHDTDEVEIQLDEGVLNPTEDDEIFTLVGTVYTDKIVKFNYMKEILATVWRPIKGMLAKEIAPNLFVFYFFHLKDMKRVLDDGPWSYDQSLLILKELGCNTSPYDVQLNKAEFWVQIHKIPRALTNLKMAEIIGENLGNFVKADISNFDGTWNAFIRLRVSIEVDKPLRRGVRIKQPNGESLWLECKYERLPTFCFICGRLGHADKYCPHQLEIDEENFVKLYGPDLRATRRSITTQANRWLRDELPTRQTQEPEAAAGVAHHHGSEGSIPRYEVGGGHLVHSSVFYSTVIDQEANAVSMGKSDALNSLSDSLNEIGDNNSSKFPSHSSVMDFLMPDQSRKRGAQDISGPEDSNQHAEEFMNVEDNGINSFVPKNVLEAGSAGQTRLYQ